MTLGRFLLWDAFIGFAALNAYALATAGLAGVPASFTEVNEWSLVFGVDLVIALTLACVWMWRHARRTGRNPLPYVVLTICTGSLGPLLYLIVGSHAGQPADVAPKEVAAV